MRKSKKYRILVLLFFIVGSCFIKLPDCYQVLAKEEKTTQGDLITQEKNDIYCDFPEDMIDPGPILPEHLEPPKITKILNTNHGIKIQWNQVKDITGYRIWRKSGKAKWKVIATITTNQFTDKTVKNGETYQYKIYAYAVNSIDFIESTGTKSITEKFSHLKAPSINRAKRLKNQKSKVSWKTNNKSNGYILQTSISNKFKKATSKKITSSKKISMNLFGLKKNKLYYVRVRAYKQNGKKLCYSAWSNTKLIK